MLEYYKATVRPACNILHEIPRVGITSNEARFLRHIHGGAEAVINVKKMTVAEVEAAQLPEIPDNYSDYLRMARAYKRKPIEAYFAVHLDEMNDDLIEQAPDITSDEFGDLPTGTGVVTPKTQDRQIRALE